MGTIKTDSDLVDMVFERLTVIGPAAKKPGSHGGPVWECRCSCGTVVVRNAYSLQKGTAKSCGCLSKELLKETRTTHGLSDHPIYQVWNHMMGRCYDTKREDYKYYGGRGIRVTGAWHDKTTFFNDMLESYKPGLTIERVDVNGNYCKENCRWATRKEQANNTRSNHFIEYKGKIQSLSVWCDELGLNYTRTRRRLQMGWSVESAFELPIKPTWSRHEKQADKDRK
jgi:hypothetical protein